MKFNVDFGAEGWKPLLELCIVGNALCEHLSNDVDGTLDVCIVLQHDTNDQVLVVVVRLLLLLNKASVCCAT